MGFMSSIPSLSAPDFPMGNDTGMLRDVLSYRENQRQRKRQEDIMDQENQFQSGLLHLKKQQEMQHMAGIMNPTERTLHPEASAGMAGAPGATHGMPTVIGPKMAPLNPSLDAYREGQLELGKGKLALEKDKAEDKNTLADRGMDIKEKLASLKDLSDSQLEKLRQTGRISLQEMEGAQALRRVETQQTGAMARTVESGNQARKTEEVRQSGAMNLEKARQLNRVTLQQLNSMSAEDLEQLRIDGRIKVVGAQGDQARETAITRAIEARKTKETPNAGSLNQSDSQKKVALQARAVQWINQNPALADNVEWSAQGFPIIKANAPPEVQMQIHKAIYGSSATSPAGTPSIGGDVNLPASGAQPVTPTTQQSVAPPTGRPRPILQMTDNLGSPIAQPTAQPVSQPAGILMITPDGKGTRMVPPDQVEIATKQGYKPKSGG